VRAQQSDRTFRRNIQEVHLQIMALAGEDPLKQVQLADAVWKRFVGAKDIRPFWEHQSRYFSSLGAMLYGIILYLHIDSCLHLTEAQRDELHDLMDKHNRPHYVIITTIHGSSDTNHDTAATIHFNDVKFTPFLKKITNDSIRRRIRITDGAGGHMKNSDIALWIARQHQQNGIVVDTTFQCTAHGKDLSDGEIGKGKEVLDNSIS